MGNGQLRKIPLNQLRFAPGFSRVSTLLRGEDVRTGKKKIDVYLP